MKGGRSLVRNLKKNLRQFKKLFYNFYYFDLKAFAQNKLLLNIGRNLLASFFSVFNEQT
jgi:hypothetical protein